MADYQVKDGKFLTASGDRSLSMDEIGDLGLDKPKQFGVQPLPTNNRASFESQGYQYLGTQQDKNEAVRRFGLDRVKNLFGNYYVVPKGLNAPKAGQPIPVKALSGGNTNLSSVLGANIPGSIDPGIAGLLSLYNQNTESQKRYEELQAKQSKLMEQVGGQGADLQAELEKQGVPKAFQQLKELNSKAGMLTGDIEKFDAETEKLLGTVEEQAIPTGLISGQQAQLRKQRELTRLTKTAELSATLALSEAYKGNIELGTELAQRSVDLKYQPILAQLDIVKNQLGFAHEAMGREDQNRSRIIEALITERQQQIAEKKAKDESLQRIAIEAASSGAPLSVVNAIRATKDPITASSLYGQWAAAEQRRKVAPKPTPGTSEGFFDYGIEQDVRSDASALLAKVQSGEYTADKAYSILRGAYSVQEASDDAIKRILGVPTSVEIKAKENKSKQLDKTLAGMMSSWLFGNNKPGF